MDPILTSDGQPFGPVRYRDIAKERYLISKHTHTSYEESGKITPTEREYLLEFIWEDLKKEQDAYEEARNNAK